MWDNLSRHKGAREGWAMRFVFALLVPLLFLCLSSDTMA